MRFHDRETLLKHLYKSLQRLQTLERLTCHKSFENNYNGEHAFHSGTIVYGFFWEFLPDLEVSRNIESIVVFVKGSTGDETPFNNIELPQISEWSTDDLKNLKTTIERERVRVGALCSKEALADAQAFSFYRKNRSGQKMSKYRPHLVLKQRLVEVIEAATGRHINMGRGDPRINVAGAPHYYRWKFTNAYTKFPQEGWDEAKKWKATPIRECNEALDQGFLTVENTKPLPVSTANTSKTAEPRQLDGGEQSQYVSASRNDDQNEKLVKKSAKEIGDSITTLIAARAKIDSMLPSLQHSLNGLSTFQPKTIQAELEDYRAKVQAEFAEELREEIEQLNSNFREEQDALRLTHQAQLGTAKKTWFQKGQDSRDRCNSSRDEEEDTQSGEIHLLNEKIKSLENEHKDALAAAKKEGGQEAYREVLGEAAFGLDGDGLGEDGHFATFEKFNDLKTIQNRWGGVPQYTLPPALLPIGRKLNNQEIGQLALLSGIAGVEQAAVLLADEVDFRDRHLELNERSEQLTLEDIKSVTEQLTERLQAPADELLATFHMSRTQREVNQILKSLQVPDHCEPIPAPLRCFPIDLINEHPWGKTYKSSPGRESIWRRHPGYPIQTQEFFPEAGRHGAILVDKAQSDKVSLRLDTIFPFVVQQGDTGLYIGHYEVVSKNIDEAEELQAASVTTSDTRNGKEVAQVWIVLRFVKLDHKEYNALCSTHDNPRTPKSAPSPDYAVILPNVITPGSTSKSNKRRKSIHESQTNNISTGPFMKRPKPLTGMKKRPDLNFDMGY